MAPDDFVESRLERRRVQPSPQAQRARRVVGGVVRLELVQEPQTLLRERQRPLPIRRCRVRRRRRPPLLAARGGETRGQPLDRRRLEQRAQRQLHSEQVAHPGDQLRRDERVSAQVEEVVPHPDPVEIQDPRPEIPQESLVLVSRSDEGRRQIGPQGAGRRKSLPVDLAARRPGELVQDDERGGDHRVGESPLQIVAQEVDREGRRRPSVILTQHEVSRQDGVALPVGARDDDTGANGGMPVQGRFDLRRLDAIPPHLDLLVEPAEEFQGPIGQKARPISGRVHAPARLAAERIREEAIGRQVRPLEVAARQPGSGDVQLPLDPCRAGLETPVQDVGTDAVDRHADRHGRPATRTDPEGAVDARLGRAVQVHQLDPETLEDPLGETGCERLAATEEAPQGPAAPDAGIVEERPQAGRHHLQDRRRFVGDQADEGRRILVGSRGRQDQSRARQKRRQELPDGGVEGAGGLLHHTVVHAERKSLVHPAHVIGDRRVRHQDALGGARRSGGVDRVGGGFSMCLEAEVRVGHPLRFAVDHLDRKDGRLVLRQPPGQPLVGQNDRGARLGEHEGEPLPGGGDIQGQEGGPGLQRPQDGDDQLGTALHQDRHQDVGPGTPISQSSCQSVGAPVQLTVGQATTLEDDGDRLGRALDLGLEERVHADRPAGGCGAGGERRRSGRRSLQSGSPSGGEIGTGRARPLL